MNNKDNESKDLEDTIVDNEFMEPPVKDIDGESKSSIISFITEYMSLSLNERIARYLINKRIRNIKNPITLDSLMHYLCINDENFPLLQLMKPNSLEMELKNKQGQTLLHVATQNKSFKILKFLVENGADIQCTDNKNNTPLHIAVNNIDYNSVQLLMKYNPKLNILNINKETPLDIARRINDRTLINILINNTDINNNNNNFNYNESKRYIRQNEYGNKGKSGDKSIKSNIYSSSLNNCSLDTKNDTEYQSVNVYKKKIISKDYQNNDENEKQIKGNKTINIVFKFKKDINDNTPYKNNSFNSSNGISPISTRTRFIYRKTSPKLINKKESYFNLNRESNLEEYESNLRHLSPGIIRKENFSNYSNNTGMKNIVMINQSNCINNNNFMHNFKNYEYDINPKMKIIHYDNLKNNNQNNTNNINNINDNNTDRARSHIIHMNNYSPIIFKDNESNDYEIKKVRKTAINNTPFSSYGKNSEDLNNDKLLEFLKEIGMQQYENILIAEGFDDINLIIKQMNEGFPILDDTLKDIGITSPGDRAKILIRMQQISDGFDFDFPFEQVFFKNNRSIQKWLKREGLQKYIKNFIDAGYQSLELLLIQMASKYKMNDKILKNEINIINDDDRKKILDSLEKNSEKYVYELSKNKSVERTYSKMIQKNSDSFCIII